MMNWIDNKIAHASLRAYLVWLILFTAYEFVVFSMPGPWASLVNATGNGTGRPITPDLMFGFPDGQPTLAFAAIGDATADYLKFNAIDLPYAFLSMMAAISIMALAIKRFVPKNVVVKSVLLVPVIYLASEVIENAMLVLMTLELLPREGSTAFTQQLVTTTKITTNGFNAVAGFLALLGYMGSVSIEYFRNHAHQ